MLKYIIGGGLIYWLVNQAKNVSDRITFSFANLRIRSAKLYITLNVSNNSNQPIQLEQINAVLKINNFNIGSIKTPGQEIFIKPNGNTKIDFLVSTGSFADIISSVITILSTKRIGRLYVDGGAVFNFGRVPFSFSYDIDKNFQILKTVKSRVGNG